VSETWARDGRPGEPSTLAPQLERLARSVLSRAGLAPQRVNASTSALVEIVLAAASHTEGRWILAPHPGAQSEWSFSRWTDPNEPEARISQLRVDRTFRAGETPLSHGSRCLWVIDYKTGAEPGGISLDAYLECQKEQWRPQLEAYGSALRAFHGDAIALRYGLYFPELLRLTWWSA
jgi:hypothetical protein